MLPAAGAGGLLLGLCPHAPGQAPDQGRQPGQENKCWQGIKTLKQGGKILIDKKIII
jgi:hypothetical protein